MTVFEPGRLGELDEPVRRYFAHAVRDGATLGRPMRLTMRGRVKAGTWLPFTAEQVTGADAFEWHARLGIGPLMLLGVEDRYANGSGSTEGRLLGRRRIFRASGPDTTRSAAGRAALEAAAFAPAALLAHPGVSWRAEAGDAIVATWTVPPEDPEVWIEIDRDGAIRAVSALRWNGSHGYVPCGCRVLAERRFGPYVVPARLEVGWWFRTPGYTPFFKAEILTAAPTPS